MKIIIVRHGLTIENKLGICQGQTEGTLSAEGIYENNQLSLRLKDIPIDIFYSSALSRTKQTLFQILKYHRGKQYLFDSRLNEWGMGKFEGNPFPSNFDFLDHLDTIEGLDEVYHRCNDFLNEIKVKHRNKTVLLVSHGLLIRMLESILLGIYIKDTTILANSSFKTFII